MTSLTKFFDKYVARHGYLPHNLKVALHTAHAQGKLTNEHLDELGTNLLTISNASKGPHGKTIKTTAERIIAKAATRTTLVDILTELNHLNEVAHNAQASVAVAQPQNIVRANTHATTLRRILQEQWQLGHKTGRPFWKDEKIFDAKKDIPGFEIHGSATMHEGAGILLLGVSGAGKSHTWAQLIKKHGHAALVDDCTNILLNQQTANIIAPPLKYRTREKQMYQDKTGDAHLPAVDEPKGVPLKHIFLLTPEEGRKTPSAHSLSQDELVEHISKMSYTMFPTLFGDNRTLNSDTWIEMTPNEKREVAKKIVHSLTTRGVNFTRINVPAQISPIQTKEQILIPKPGVDIAKIVHANVR